MPESETNIYAAIADLDTTIRALNVMADGGDDDVQTILYFMVSHLRPIHEKLTDEFEKLEKQRLHAVS